MLACLTYWLKFKLQIRAGGFRACYIGIVIIESGNSIFSSDTIVINVVIIIINGGIVLHNSPSIVGVLNNGCSALHDYRWMKSIY